MTRFSRSFSGRACAVLAASLSAPLSAAPLAVQDTPASIVVALPHDTGPVRNTGAQPQVVASFPVIVQGARWLRLHFADVELSGDVFSGNGAILRITSLYDGHVQELDAVGIQQWGRSSAYFNGDSLLVEIVAPPTQDASRARLALVSASDLNAPLSVCTNADQRVLSSDPRLGRAMPVGCTAWIVNDCNSCLITAGHCAITPDNLDVIEFNVPLSLADGSPLHPAPQDQYAVDDSSTQSTGFAPLGADYAHFGCFPNPSTGLTPFQAQGARFTLAPPPAFQAGANLRVTGYGLRATPPEWNLAQQTDDGAWSGSQSTTLLHQVDTTGGNSGAPIVLEASGEAIGVHTHAGCSPFGGSNGGTRSDHPGLAAYLAVPQGVCAAGLSLVGGPLVSVSALGATPLLAQAGGSFVPGTATLHYSFDGAPFVAQPLVAGAGGLFSGAVPQAPCGSTVRYYLSIESSVCGVLTQPPGAPNASFSAPAVGFEFVLRSEDFEQDSGWTTSTTTAFAGLWERGVPVNDPLWGFDPLADFDGSGQCWLTQNTSGNSDVDGGAVVLTSPPLDLRGGAVALRYAYYLFVTVADGSDGLRVEASDNGAVGPWRTVALHTSSGGTSWRNHEVRASDLAAAGVAATGDVRVRFVAFDGALGTVVEAGVDAFRVVRSTCAQIESYCSSGPGGATLTAQGTASLSANNLVLRAGPVPAQKFGLFFCAREKRSSVLPIGVRCLGLPARLLPVQLSGSSLVLDYALDFGALAPTFDFQAGELWNFQCWFRVGGGASELSDALQVVFTP